MGVTRRGLLQGAVVAAGAAALPTAVRSRGATIPRSLRPDGPAQLGPYKVLAGSLHDHSLDSDGDSAAELIADWMAAHHHEIGVDFAALSDHSDFFPLHAGQLEATINNGLTTPTSTPSAYSEGAHTCGHQVQTHCIQAGDPSIDNDPTYLVDMWRRQAALMDKYASKDFSFIRGFEWTNDQENHLDVLLSSNWTSRLTTGDAALNMGPFWEWFDAKPTPDLTGFGIGLGGGDGVGMFNHPGDKGALNWDDYGLNKKAVPRMSLIEVHGNQTKAGRGNSDAGWYWFALSQGWIVSPVMNWDWHTWTGDGIVTNNHPGNTYGVDGYLPGQRSLILSHDATVASIRSALLARRTSASEVPDLWATLRVGNSWQGSTIAAKPGETISFTVEAYSATEPLTRIDIISDNGVDPYPYYYGDNPSWDSFHSQLTPSYVLQHEKWETSGGRTTRKATIDTPPPGTIVASKGVRGERVSGTIDVKVPLKPSPRPDGRHFFYAIAYAGSKALPARCWTGPILTY